jgi:hypothetical protein
MQLRTSEGKFRFASIQAFFTASVIKPLSTILTNASKNARNTPRRAVFIIGGF